jgi:virulence-associated protein VagC
MKGAVEAMSETVMNTNAIPAFVLTVLKTDKVRVHESNRVVTIVPVDEKQDIKKGLRGMLSAYPIMSVDKFLERKHADKELDL